MDNKFFQMIPGIGPEELTHLNSITKDLTEDQLQTFLAFYNGERKKPDTILIGCILGFIIVAGVQRFMVGQIGMGILYLFTGGLCLVGTIIDTINYKKLAFEFNQQVAIDALNATKNIS